MAAGALPVARAGRVPDEGWIHMVAEDQPLLIISPSAHELIFPLQVGLLEPIECYNIVP